MPSYYDTIDGPYDINSMMIDDQHQLRVVNNYVGVVNNDSGYVMLQIYK